MPMTHMCTFMCQAGGMNPCPAIDFTGGFNAWLAAAYNLTANMTIENMFGAPFGESLNRTLCPPMHCADLFTCISDLLAQILGAVPYASHFPGAVGTAAGSWFGYPN